MDSQRETAQEHLAGLRPIETELGSYMPVLTELLSIQPSLDAVVALGYKQLMRVEECWRSMKLGLRMRPVYHWKPHRIEAHVKLCVLALLLERIAEIRAGDTWRNLVAQFDTIKVVEYERGEVKVRQTTELRREVVGLLKQVGVPAPPRLHHVESAPERLA